MDGRTLCPSCQFFEKEYIERMEGEWWGETELQSTVFEKDIEIIERSNNEL